MNWQLAIGNRQWTTIAAALACAAVLGVTTAAQAPTLATLQTRAERTHFTETSRYDDAVILAVDLRDLARRSDGSRVFTARFDAMRRRQVRRRGFFDRWKRANEDGLA